MSHASAFELLPDLALNLLQGEEAGQVAEHVETCPACRAELRALTQAGEALAFGTEPMAMPAGAEARIAAGVRARLADVQLLGEAREGK